MANIRTKKQKEKGQVGKKNMSKFNPYKMDPFVNKPDDASTARTKKEQEQARDERFISPTKGKVKTELGRNLALGAGSIDRKTGKQIVSKDRDIPTRAQEKERALIAKNRKKRPPREIYGYSGGGKVRGAGMARRRRG